ncbi:MAG: hypothetical protein WCS42_12245 [Verrucomicrobiota bacterium]
MKRVGTFAFCLAGGLLWSAGLRADDIALSGNPYGVVVERNIFGLNPPPLVDPNAAVVEPLAKIVPNGIMSIFGQLQVLFKVAGKPPAKDANYILMEGQSQDEIEVVKIDEKAGIVSFNNHGIPQDLPLVVTAPTAPPSTPTGGGNAGFPAMRPGGGAPAAGPAGNNPFMNRFGNREGGANLPKANNNTPTGGGGGMPGFGFGATGGGNQTSQGGSQLSAEENAIWIEAQREKYRSENNPISKILPPTPLTPLLNDNANGGPPVP